MIRTTTCAAATALAALLTVTPHPAAANPVEGVRFADTVVAGGRPLELSCAALLRYMVFIKAYVAGLYLAPGTPADTVLADVPKRLEIEYFHAIGAADFAKATQFGIEQNLDAAAIAALRPRIDRLNAMYADVRPGDRYALTYVPGAGTELSLNGQSRGQIEGADFAAAVFGIWLGPNPIDAALKQDLLECRA